MEEIREHGAAAASRLNSFICLDSSRPFRRASSGNSTSSRRRSTPPVSTKSPGRLPEKASKRKQESPIYEPVFVESCLIQLCRGGNWTDVVQRCLLHPEEASIVPLYRDSSHKGNFGEEMGEPLQRHSTKPHSNLSGLHGDDRVLLYRETPLGIVCASEEIGNTIMVPVVKALVAAEPRQVGASQLLSGHTPLRDAILNRFCTREILMILLQATSLCSDGTLAFRCKDQSGMTILEHLIATVQLGTTMHFLDILKVILEMVPSEMRQTNMDGSPLIMLLATGNSFGPASRGINEEYSPETGSEEFARLTRVLQVAKLLLDDDPSLLFSPSRVSHCSPLHVALRNYGTCETLIHELIQRDTEKELMQSRNLYGDLPLHVACSVGVPLNVLKLVLENTIKSSSNAVTGGFGKNVNPLAWSINNSGYTPVDLEWVRHIESGNDFSTARSFYPLEPTGVRRHCFKQDEYYNELLREAVDQVMKTSTEESGIVTRVEDARSIFGTLIDRISFLIRAATYFGSDVPDALFERSLTLSDVCKLCSFYNPSLPLPILNLFLWLRAEDIVTSDAEGWFPIHHVLSGGTTTGRDRVLGTATYLKDWCAFVVQLLDRCPEQCRMKTFLGELPLHVLLDHSAIIPHTVCLEDIATTRHSVIEKLVEMYPESLEQRDPVSDLYPFMMAANDPTLSVNTVYCLLRHSPATLASQTL